MNAYSEIQIELAKLTTRHMTRSFWIGVLLGVLGVVAAIFMGVHSYRDIPNAIKNTLREDGIRNAVDAIEQDAVVTRQIRRQLESNNSLNLDRIECRELIVQDENGRKIAVITKDSGGGGAVRVRHPDQEDGHYCARIVAGTNGGQVDVRDHSTQELARLFVEGNRAGHLIARPRFDATWEYLTPAAWSERE